jgi:hypothetical protein
VQDKPLAVTMLSGGVEMFDIKDGTPGLEIRCRHCKKWSEKAVKPSRGIRDWGRHAKSEHPELREKRAGVAATLRAQLNRGDGEVIWKPGGGGKPWLATYDGREAIYRRFYGAVGALLIAAGVKKSKLSLGWRRRFPSASYSRPKG